MTGLSEAVRIEVRAKGALIDGVLVPLTRSEQALLSWLVTHAGTPQSRETLLTRVWGYEAGVRSRTVDATMNRLRSKLAGLGAAGAIRTVRGQGWVYEAPRAPAGETPFVGRAAEQEGVARWLAGEGALLTVAGEPGIGKTALVERIAGDRVRRVDADLIGDATDWFRTADCVRPGDVLWVDGADLRMELLRAVLSARPAVRLLVTCRRPLRHPAEQVLRLGPLPPDDAAALAVLLQRPPGDVAEAEGNPLLLRADRAEAARRVARSLRALRDEERTALDRLAAVPSPIPLALAREVAGEAVDALIDASLLRDGETLRVPAVVRCALRPDPTVAAEVLSLAGRWLLEHVEAFRLRGDAPWIERLTSFDAELPAIEWIARDSGELPVVEAAVAALDDHQRLVDPSRDLGPAFDAAIARGLPLLVLRRGAWRARIGDRQGAEADRLRYEQWVGDVAGVDAARAAMAGAMSASHVGELARAESLARRALAWAEANEHGAIEALSRFVLAEVALDTGDVRRALAEARAARTVPLEPGRTGHTVTAFFGRFLHEAGLDDEAREALDESRRMALAIGFSEGVAFTDAVLAWIDVAALRDPTGIARLQAATDVLASRGSGYTSGTALRVAWAEIVAGSPERGLSGLRGTVRTLRPQEREVVHSWAFAVAARVRLGLPARAPWMGPAEMERDPGVVAAVRGLEAAAAGDLAAARAADREIRDLPTSRVRALRWVLLDLIGAEA